ncbi:FeoC-like transcriptional regulator [Azospirillum halopraeferens]|uniref:FeoC-like transcriptional regulator n=1 Tax=Azospirillum halopraeferens TaxID=34010 RepID=UPI000554986E|nr:FeoC-like transcriptional regulator [Azospirillum halopraeferens]
MATLSDVRRYLSERHRASLADIAPGVGTTADAARALLDHWAARGRVRHLTAACDGRCGKSCCDGSAYAEIYEWVDRPPAA